MLTSVSCLHLLNVWLSFSVQIDRKRVVLKEEHLDLTVLLFGSVPGQKHGKSFCIRGVS